MIDMKNGESYDGTLLGIDSFMNVKLQKVTITSASGKFSKVEECFLRGNHIQAI